MGVGGAAIGGGGAKWPPDYYGQQNAYEQQMSSMQGMGCGGAGGQAMNALNQSTTRADDMATDNEAIPDISLVRVAKWAIVLLVAMALGEKFWSMFGPRISANLHKAIGGPVAPPPP